MTFAKKFTSSVVLPAVGILLCWPSSVQAADAANPDWPCISRKVVEMDAVTIWDGPSLDTAKDWQKDDSVRKLSAYVISRRLKDEEVDAAIKKFAESVPEASRDQKLTELFAATLSRTNDERKIVMSGIERFHKRQLEIAKQIESKGITLPKQGDAPPAQTSADPSPAGKIEDLKMSADEQMAWQVRVFQERQENIPIACEIPALMDERAGLVARSIRALMKS